MANKINIGTEINLEDLLQSRLLIQANSGGGKSVLARVIIEETFGKVPFIVMDIEGEYYTLKEKYGDVLIIGGQHADIPISMKSVKLLPKEIISNRLSVVIDLSDLQMNERILYSKYFIETMMDLPKDYWINYLVFIEEAHKLCGEQDKQASATAVKDLMSRGRKRGYCGVLLTQRISKLHKDAAAECNNKFIGKTFLDLDIDRAAKELGWSSGTDKNTLRTLKPGTFYAFGTSIIPNHVHEVKINLPKTKIVRAGVNLDIKPKAPTEKIKSMLAKLNDLPAAADKELKTIADLQKEISRLKKELSSKTVSQPVTTDNRQAEKVKELQQLLKEKENDLVGWKKLAVARGVLLNKFKDQIIDHLAGTNNSEIITKFPKIETFVQKTGTNFPKSEKVSHSVNGTVRAQVSNGSLGKCPLAIFAFLASYPDRSWSKAQVGIATGYSPGSGGFNNSLSELTVKGLIIRDGGKLQYNSAANVSEYLGPDFEPQVYSIETFKSKLGKCEREIYDVLLENPHDKFSKESLAAQTPSQYSHSSGGFNNALSTLNTLELIKRESGVIRLNPELLEI